MTLPSDDFTPRPLPAWVTTLPIAHRGLHTLPETPENSHAAFAAAIDAGYPIELDVRRTADGEAVVFHDNDLGRLTGVPGPFRERVAKDLRDLRLLGTSEPIPLFSETLAFVAGRTPLLVEVKVDAGDPAPLDTIKATLEVLKGYTGPFVIQSFHLETVLYLAAHAPEIVRGQLSTNDLWRESQPEAPLPDFIAYSLSSLPTPLTEALRTRGIPLLAWTIQTEEQRERARSVADNIIFEHIKA